MEEQLEALELIVGETLFKASITQLHELAEGASMQIVGKDAMRKPRLIKDIRKIMETSMGETLEEQVDYYTKISDALEVIMEDAGKDGHTPGGAEADETPLAPDLSGDTPNPAAQQLAAALQSLVLPQQTSSLYKRLLKIVGVIGSKDAGKSINYTNLVSQINDAKQSGYTSTEIARAVKQAVAPSSHLRTYFDASSTMTLVKMLTVIRDFVGEKNASELFTELGRLCQTTQETPTEFLIRGFQLRQKVIAASQVENVKYDFKLVHDTFCRSVRTGILDDQIRAHMRLFLDPKRTATSDEELLREMNVASSETDETSSKMKRGATKKVTINESRVVSHDDLSPIIQGITMLQQQMSEMRETRGGTRKRTDGDQDNNTRRDEGKAYTPWRVYKCKKCKEANAFRCQHCFNCGSEQHQARNCDQKNEERLQRK